MSNGPGASTWPASSALDHTVFFNDGWVPYAERGAWLAEADIGVSAHFDDIETRFAFRTRLLDYLWAGLPIVTTRAMSFPTSSRSAGSDERSESETWTAGIRRSAASSTTRLR